MLHSHVQKAAALQCLRSDYGAHLWPKRAANGRSFQGAERKRSVQGKKRQRKHERLQEHDVKRRAPAKLQRRCGSVSGVSDGRCVRCACMVSAPAAHGAVVGLRLSKKAPQELGIVHHVSVAPLPQRGKLLPCVRQRHLEMRTHMAKLQSEQASECRSEASNERGKHARGAAAGLFCSGTSAERETGSSEARSTRRSAHVNIAGDAQVRAPPGVRLEPDACRATCNRGYCACTSPRRRGTPPGAAASSVRKPAATCNPRSCSAGCAAKAPREALRPRERRVQLSAQRSRRACSRTHRRLASPHPCWGPRHGTSGSGHGQASHFRLAGCCQ